MWCEDDGKWLLLLVLVCPKIKYSSVLERDIYDVYYSFIPEDKDPAETQKHRDFECYRKPAFMSLCYTHYRGWTPDISR